MASDMFKHVPTHVTYLFVFLCTCQLLLLLYLSKKNISSNINFNGNEDNLAQSNLNEKHWKQRDLAPIAGPHNGKLRLLWSLKGSGGGGSSSNEASEQNMVPIYQDNLAESPTDIKQSKGLPPFNAPAPHNGSLGLDNGAVLSDYTFHYVINQPYVCQGPGESPGTDEGDEGPSPYMVVLVHSHPSHKPQRDAIRDTWGGIRKEYDAKFPVRIVFILGQSDFDSDLKIPTKESAMYKDIVMGNFTDTYQNLTLKSLFGLQWALEFCSQVSYAMKTDDDVYFNVSNLIQTLSVLKAPVQMLGSLNVNSEVQRHGLWRVSDRQFPANTYPPYCSGCAYVLSHNIVSSLLSAAGKAPLIPIEDVYVTGLLANLTNIRCQGTHLFPQWYMGPSPKHMCLLLNARIFGLHNVPYEKMYYIHRKLKMGHVCKT